MNKGLVTAFLLCASLPALACEIPPLVQIPTDKPLDARAAERVRAEFASYYEAMTAYTSCIQAELASAGGDNAPELVRAAYVVRNNSAVAEFAAMQKVFAQAVAPAGAQGPEPGAPQ